MVKDGEKTTRKSAAKKPRRKSELEPVPVDIPVKSTLLAKAESESPQVPQHSTSSDPVTNAPIITSTKRMMEGDLYKRVVAYEEAESLKRDPEQDITLFQKTCETLRQYMMEINELKKQNTEQNSSQIQEKRIAASLLFVNLKKINRLEKFRTKHSRDTLNRVKQQVDSYHLQLQNLLYETMHLQKEVIKCLEFKSKDEEIDLVPLNVFYEEAPANISRKEETCSNEHQQKLARLEWELEQRKRLSAQCLEMTKNKENVAADITKQTDYLDNICPQLQCLMKAMIPVQEQMGLCVDKIRKLHKTASFLPAPLYVLFVQLEAYMDAIDKHIQISVEGDEDEAISLISDTNKDNEQDDSDSEQEAEPLEDLNEGKIRRRRKLSKVDRQEERRMRLMLKHPLRVKLVIKLQKFSEYLTLTFFYLMNLNVVTVQCEVHLVQQYKEGVCAGDLLSSRLLLTALLPNDLGQESPNAANFFQLRNAGLDQFSHYISELGHPYHWVQQMAGLNFLGVSNEKAAQGEQGMQVKSDPLVSRTCVPDLIRTIRDRFKARLALARQVQDFESGEVTLIPGQKKLFPPRLSTSLDSWQPMVWSDYCQLQTTQHLVELHAVTEADLLYRASFSRGSAKLIAWIAIKPDHPKEAPVFSLNLHWKGVHNSNNDDAIRDMEREVNVYCKELVKEKGLIWSLLSAQMYQLMSCLDIYLEASGVKSSLSPEFTKDRIFFKAVRGRNRNLPYKYIPTGGGRFAQR